MSNITVEKLQIALGTHLKNVRKVAGVSQTELGAVISLHQTAVCRVEQGSQSLTPAELYILAQYFQVSVNDLITGDLDYWAVAERFKKTPPFPERFRKYPHSRVRGILPFILFLRNTEGQSATEKILDRLGLKLDFLCNPDQKLGTQLELDLVRALIQQKLLNKHHLRKVALQGHQPEVHGFLTESYKSQATSAKLIGLWSLNATHYESNFSYEIQDCADDSITLSMTPAEHMQMVDYKDNVLGDFLCEYRKSFLTELPRFIGRDAAQISEEKCHFRSGADQCLYRLEFVG